MCGHSRGACALRKQCLRDRAATAAEKTSSKFFTAVGVMALAIAVGVALPAEAKKRAQKPAEEPIADPANGEPMILVVSLGSQKVDVYRGMTLITSSSVSTGMPAHATKAGVFSILEKQRVHHSNIYSGAPMPWMNRITWSGTALHAGVVPGYPASHGCIRLPFSFAPKLFQITTKGDNVIVARDRLAPQLIEHPVLFQPLPPPPAPVLVKQDQPPERQSSNETAPALKPRQTHPGMLARADVAGSTTDVPSSLEAEAAKQEAAPTLKVEDPAAVEDTHVHAFDPFVGGQAPQAEVASTSGHALDEDNGTSGSSSVSAAAPNRPVAVPEPVAAKAETPKTETPAPPAPTQVASTTKAAATVAAATPIEAETSAKTETDRLTPEPEVAKVTPEPEIVAPPAVKAVAVTPQAGLAEASATVDAAPSSIVATKAGAGVEAVAVLAAEPRSTAPLRILVTRRTQRDRVIGVQQILADMGYLAGARFRRHARQADGLRHQGVPKGQLDA